MIRNLRYLILVVLGLGLLVVAMANRIVVPVALMPPDLAAFLGIGGQIELPLFLVMFGGIVVGLLIGFLWEWVRERKHRTAASTNSRQVRRLERELAVLQDSSSLPTDDVLAILERPKSR